MNKTKRFLAGIIALSAVIFFSCNNLSNGKVIENGKPVLSNEKVSLSVAVDGMYTSAEIPGVSRNIMPIEWDEDGERIRSLKYVLTGSPVGTPFAMTEVPATAWSYDDIKDGNAKIDLDAIEWTLTLTAYQGYTDAANPGVIALQSNPKLVDLSTGAATVNFDLLPPSDTDATGDVAVTITFEMPSSFDHVIYGIYKNSLPATNTDVQLVDSTVTSITPITAKIGAGLTEVETGKYNFEYKTTDSAKVKAGKYSFNATFYAKVDGVDKVICFYSDSIQIDGGNLTKKDITISKEAFNAPAVNPTSLAVDYSYNNNGLNPVELTNSTVDGKYLATFTWDDNSDNELGFELVITDVAASTETVYDRDSTLKAGSLAASSETATVELETGKEYSAKIRAVNNFTTTSPSDSDYYSTTERIFLFTVAYNLDHGKIQKDASTSTADSIVTYVVPYTPYTATPVTPDLITKAADTVVYPYVFRTGYHFLKWYVNDPTETAYTAIPTPYTGNIVLTAYWQSELGVTISTPDYSTISDYKLVKKNTLDGLYDEAAVYEVDGKTTNTVTLTPNDGLTDVNWTIQNYTDSSEITTGKSVDGATKALTWTITGVDAATYRIAVSGKKDGENVTGNIYIKIER